MSDSTSSVLGPIPLPTAVPSQVEPEPAPACRVKIHVRFLEEAPPSGSRPPLTSVIGRHESAVLGTERSPHLSVSEVSRGEQDAAFIKRFLMHYGIYRRYPLGRFLALRNAWRAAQP